MNEVASSYGNRREFETVDRDCTVSVRNDGCVDIRRYCNGDRPGDQAADPDYLHVCDLEEFIQQLTQVAEATKEFRAS